MGTGDNSPSRGGGVTGGGTPPLRDGTMDDRRVRPVCRTGTGICRAAPTPPPGALLKFIVGVHNMQFMALYVYIYTRCGRIGAVYLHITQYGIFYYSRLAIIIHKKDSPGSFFRGSCLSFMVFILLLMLFSGNRTITCVCFFFCIMNLLIQGRCRSGRKESRSHPFNFCATNPVFYS